MRNAKLSLFAVLLTLSLIACWQVSSASGNGNLQVSSVDATGRAIYSDAQSDATVIPGDQPTVTTQLPNQSPMTGIPCADGCLAPDNGSGTVDLPASCPYFTITDSLRITNGLPVGTTVEITAKLYGFFNIVSSPGGMLGGDFQDFQGSLELHMQGTGTLSSYFRILTVPVGGTNSLQIHNAPRGVGSPQSFNSDLFRFFGQITSDPDFDLLRIVAGTDFGMPSPGHTTLTLQPGGNWAVDSFFDITYRIDFVGHSPSPFGGMSGSTTDVSRLDQGHHFWTPSDGAAMHFPQLPDPTGWDVYGTAPMVVGDDWKSSETGPVKDIHFWGSWLNDNVGIINSFDISIRADVPAGFDLPYSHPGSILWQRNITDFCTLPVYPGPMEGWYNPYPGVFIPNNHFSYYQHDIKLGPADWFFQTSGQIYWLCITANVADPATFWGWKSSTNHFLDDATWLQLSPGTCVDVDNGTGTIDLPAPCPYLTELGVFHVIDGFPPGSQLDAPGRLRNFFNIFRTPGGLLGGEFDQFLAFLDLSFTGTGLYSGYVRSLTIPNVQVRVDNAPRTPGMPIQSFPSDLTQLQGQIVGDPDFDLLRITAGSAFGMPSPGHTTLTRLPGGQWNVDSFFDITYRIDFIGAPAGPFAGRSGSTTGTVRMHQGSPLVPIGPWIDIYEPPTFVQSLDLAFAITNGVVATPCDCSPGDADGSGGVPDISDAVYLIAYIFGGGPNPTPYATCSGDANCDCGVDISDAVYLISFIFGGGPAPCDCATWRTLCGPTLH